ncbi:sensor histidine kinase [Anaerovorax odorimutans]|uniref:sensor histidine kinase n=1 Tax=Anaerovorax odorimutans TaxID=109327 RepID=UPI0003FDC542|nr:ATP-binding protein [Anaerovorax odorimutans]
MNKVKHTLIVAFCIAFASLFHIDLFIEGFIITLSVILFPIFLDNYHKLNPIKTAIVTGFVSPIFREIIVYLQMGDLKRSLYLVVPDIIFYFTYGVLYYFLYYRSKKENDYIRFFFTVFACDLFSNIAEMCIRTRIIGFSAIIIKGLIIIALVRAIIILIIIIFLKNFKSFLIHEEHERRYMKLMILSSSFKSEIYFMNKNINEIEDITKKAFKAYRIIEEQKYSEELKNLALDISKDIHEIKKDYIRVIAGLKELSIEQLDVSGMSINDIIRILKSDTDEQIRIGKLDIIFTVDVKVSFYVEEHFYLMSILKNLITNSIECLYSKRNGKIKLEIFQSGEDYIFNVIDNGNGIKKNDIEFIFNPGFSTKFDKETGNIGIGIGLTLVRDLVQDIFHGSLSLKSLENKGTIFTIMIPINSLKADPPIIPEKH